VHAARRFQMPERASRANGAAPDNAPFWYAFTYGSAHFVVTSSEHDVAPGSRQYAWLQAELQSVDRCRTPWLVVVMHRPMYVVFPHKDNRVVGEHLAQQIEGLLAASDVDLVISGHVHTYCRTCPVYKEKCFPGGRGGGPPANGTARAPGNTGKGVVHLVVGTAGHELSDVDDSQYEWVAATRQRYGYVRATVAEGAMHVEFVSSETGAVLDRAKLHNDWASSEQCRQRGVGERVEVQAS
jgi:hypothetical protein